MERNCGEASKFHKISTWLLVAGASVLVHYLFSSKDGPVVQISEGKLVGNIATSRDGREYFQFLSIPYAKPPVGELRFESPVPAEPWEGIRRADRRSPECLATEILTTGRTVGQEDCLYLNVYTPVKQLEGRYTNETKQLLPVIAYIHGGAFVMGSTRIYGADYFMDEDVVLVTMNYRLGALGFLNTGDEVVRGNMGLKDQTLALRWIQRNIASFGGDPRRVTIAGESAGGASVHLHMMSPMSKGLFHRAISMSGTAAHLDWAMDRNHSETAQELGKKVGCPIDSSAELVECLKGLPEAEIGRSQEDEMDLWTHLKHFYAPSIEAIADSDAFIAESPMELLRSGRFVTVPWMEGLYEYEGLIYVLRFLHNGVDPQLLKERNFRNANFAHLLYQYDIEDDHVWDRIYEFYFNASTTLTQDEMIVSLANLMSDRFFVKGAYDAGMIHAQKAQVYMYYMTYMGRTNIFSLLRDIRHKSWVPFELQMIKYFIRLFSSWIFGTFEGTYGASHGDDVLLLFNGNDGVTGIPPYCRDYEFSKDLIKVLVDFAYGENPLPFRNRIWHPTPNSTTGPNFMRLDDDPAMIPDPFEKRMRFFNTLPF